MSRLPQPRAILFDWDNTLVDTWPTIHQALNATLRHMEHPEWSLEQVMKNVKQSMRDSFPAMFGERWKEAGDHYIQSYRSMHLDSLQPLPGAEEMLKALPETLFVAVVSNKRGPTLRQEIEHMGWGPLIDIAVGSDDAVRDKPHPDPALLALAASDGISGTDAWFVGDTIVDLECAGAIGATPVLYGAHKPENGMYDGFPFAAHVQDQQALKALILKYL